MATTNAFRVERVSSPATAARKQYSLAPARGYARPFVPRLECVHFVDFRAVRAAWFPSPQPSPVGRGRIVRRAGAGSARCEWSQRAEGEWRVGSSEALDDSQNCRVDRRDSWYELNSHAIPCSRVPGCDGAGHSNRQRRRRGAGKEDIIPPQKPARGGVRFESPVEQGADRGATQRVRLRGVAGTQRARQKISG